MILLLFIYIIRCTGFIHLIYMHHIRINSISDTLTLPLTFYFFITGSAYSDLVCPTCPRLLHLLYFFWSLGLRIFLCILYLLCFMLITTLFIFTHKICARLFSHLSTKHHILLSCNTSVDNLFLAYVTFIFVFLSGEVNTPKFSKISLMKSALQLNPATKYCSTLQVSVLSRIILLPCVYFTNTPKHCSQQLELISQGGILAYDQPNIIANIHSWTRQSTNLGIFLGHRVSQLRFRVHIICYLLTWYNHVFKLLVAAIIFCTRVIITTLTMEYRINKLLVFIPF